MTVAAYLRFDTGITALTWSEFVEKYDLTQNPGGMISSAGVYVEASHAEDATHELDIDELKITSEDDHNAHTIAAMAIMLWSRTQSWFHADSKVSFYVKALWLS